ncbi:hypothetical protein AVEN_108855-1 [Araneus ventricosus]|uniref:PiggyBac transposable element-derived protein domain-containing protein n=1 Tax=Araneus ventricosus TaxID=182803 RepID=A0A4Y2AHG0_ARAVE|nr:hypothetical protein AVEN_108855-1 [Araneus ventricosus]
MPRKFLTVQEALNCLWTLDDSDLDDIDNELVILPEDTDDSSTRKIEETMCDDQCITSNNKYKNGIDLFDNHAAAHFTSIQRNKMVLAFIFINAFETAFVAS